MLFQEGRDLAGLDLNGALAFCTKHQRPRVWRGPAKPRSHLSYAWLLLLMVLVVVAAYVHTLPNPPACRSSLGCMIGRRAGTV